ncbi:MAG: transglycosylase domain-containing protein [Fimbriimonas sp.]
MASKNTGRKLKRKKPIWVRRVKQAFAFGTILFLGAFATLFVMFLLKLREAEEAIQTPENQDVMEAVTRPPTRVVTADNVELFRISAEHRIAIKDLKEIPLHVRSAMMAAEDHRFYDHPGVDNVSLMRAFFSIFKEGRVSQGGSTITMQLAKLLYSGNERSLKRKIQDIAYAYAIEKYKTKDQILLLYLNKVYFGEGAHGIGAAAKVYLNKSVKDLTASDAALLARCVRLPSRYNPMKDLKLEEKETDAQYVKRWTAEAKAEPGELPSLRNRNVVLRIMREEGMLNEKQYDRALSEVPKLNANPPRTTALYTAGYGQHFVDDVINTIKRDMPELDLKTGGYLIQTTIDSKLQKLAEKVTRDVVRQERHNKVNQGAFVAMDSDGKILCEVGGVNYHRNQFNIITQGSRQPGSAFKAFVYATALQQGVISGPETTLSNERIYIHNEGSKPWSPENSSPRENAPTYSADVAFAWSINRPAIHLLQDTGINNVIQYAHENFGFKSKLQPYLPLAIGASDVKPIEMLEGYSVFANGGDRVKPYAISRIVSPAGEVIKQYQPQKFTGMLSPNVVAVMDELMYSVVNSSYGTGMLARPVPNARGKTGTTNNARDAWFCGYADGVVGVGWVGNEQIVNGVATPMPMSSATYGGTITVKIWTGVMKSARERFGHVAKVQPPATVAAAVPPVKRSHDDEVKPPIDEPISKPVDDEPPPDDVIVKPPDQQNPPPVTDPAELERQRQEAERVAEQERQRALERERERERQRQEEAERRANSDSVTIEVCAESGQPANMYCPETVTRTFLKSRAPRRPCKIHGPG